MQTVQAFKDDQLHTLTLPASNDEVMSGLQWGFFDQPGTAAFWAATVWMSYEDDNFKTHKLGETILEEIMACLLGGFGLKAEIGLAAYFKIKNYYNNSGKKIFSQDELEEKLSEPLSINGKYLKYRFPKQKAKYLAGILNNFDENKFATLSDLEARNYLITFPGIGYKTASWVVRNWRSSDEVAIIDVHIMRAMQILGVYEQGACPQKDYLMLEKKFLSFANAIRTKASDLDAIVWDVMRKIPNLKAA